MKKLMLCLLGILLLGCSTRLGDFTVLSTRNVEIGGDYILVERNVEGEDVVPIIIFFPFILTYFIGPLGVCIYWIIRLFYAKKIRLYD